MKKRISTPSGFSVNTFESPDDEQATFRTKSRESSRGYVANLTETCDEENNLQLISRMNVAGTPNLGAHLQIRRDPPSNLPRFSGIYNQAFFRGV